MSGGNEVLIPCLAATLALFLPALAAWPWTTRLIPASSMATRLCCAWPLGLAVLSLGEFFGSFAAGLGWWSGLGSLCLLALSGWNRKNLIRPQIAWPKVSWLKLCICLILIFLASNAWYSMAKLGVEQGQIGVPCLGVWGLKAEAMWTTQNLPWQQLQDPDQAWSHPEYPLYWPVILYWIKLWSGGDCAAALKWGQLLLGLGVSGQILWLLRERLKFDWPWAIGLTALIQLGSTSEQVNTQLYAENLLLLSLIPALALSQETGSGRTLSFLLFGAAAWTKQEGLLCWLLILLPLGLAALREKSAEAFPWRSVIFTALIFVLPWRLICQQLQLGFHDFALSAYDLGKIRYAWIELKALHQPQWDGQIVLSLGISLLWLGKWSELRSPQRFLCLMFWPGLPLFFLACFAFSTRDIEWHVGALDRLLYVSSLCSIAAIASTSCRVTRT